MRAHDFFAFARERHATYLRRQAGEPEPWTHDPIIARYRFTNVFRELDRTTVWFRENLRDPFLAHMNPEVQVLGTILFRTLNRIESGEVLFKRDWDGEQPVGLHYLLGMATERDLEEVLRSAIPRGPWVTGAYIVKTPDGMDKLRGALWIVEEARKRLPATLAALGPAPTLQGLHSALQAYPYIGGFTGYEIVSDLRWLPILQDAPDILTWAHAGPGAVRGLNRLWDRPLKKSLPQYLARTEMHTLLRLALNLDEPIGGHWPVGQSAGPQNLRDAWPRWEMREVEHTLCEFDKYERVRLGEGKPRGRFR